MATREAESPGASSCAPLAFYDPVTCSWRMSQLSFLATGGGDGSEPYSGRWPRSGTMRNGTVYPRQPSVPLTSVTDFSLLPTPLSGGAEGATGQSERFPTPRFSDADRGGRGDLLGVVKLRPSPSGRYPTPRASEWKGVGRLGSSSHQHMLQRGYLNATVQEKEQASGRLNPHWVGWLMGFPPGWIGKSGSEPCADSETP